MSLRIVKVASGADRDPNRGTTLHRQYGRVRPASDVALAGARHTRKAISDENRSHLPTSGVESCNCVSLSTQMKIIRILLASCVTSARLGKCWRGC